MGHMADLYVVTAAQEADSVAELAASRKSAKYTNLDSGYIFQPIAMETLGLINDSVRNFVKPGSQDFSSVRR